MYGLLISTGYITHILSERASKFQRGDFNDGQSWHIYRCCWSSGHDTTCLMCSLSRKVWIHKLHQVSALPTSRVTSTVDTKPSSNRLHVWRERENAGISPREGRRYLRSGTNYQKETKTVWGSEKPAVIKYFEEETNQNTNLQQPQRHQPGVKNA